MEGATSIADLATRLKNRQTFSLELIGDLYTEIEASDDKGNIFTALLTGRMLDAAEASDTRRGKNRTLGPLDGIPIAIKDNLHIAGYETCAGTGYDFSNTFSETAKVVQQLENAGAIVIGKCNMDEAALGASTNNKFYGQCDNPRYPGHTPGGSSGGSAAVVAAGYASASLGTDTMGSVRIPAAYCELWGLKPTQGLVSSIGLVPLSTQLDTIGPIATCARDLKLMLAAMTGNPIGGGSTADNEQNHVIELGDLKIGVVNPKELTDTDGLVLSAFEAMLQRLSESGCRFEQTVIEGWTPGQLRRDGLLLCEVEASEAMATPLDQSAASFSKAFHSMMEYGRSANKEKIATSAARIDTLKASTLDCFQQYDALLLPTAPQLAFPVDDEIPANQADFTALANVAGSPAISFPIAIPGNSRLASAQLLAKPGSDFWLVDVAEELDKLLN